MTRREVAEKYFLDGYNCAQSVVLAFKDLVKIDEATLSKLSSSFGGGMGHLREVCGAVSGMFMIYGLLKGYTGNGENGEKAAHYKQIQALASEFKEKNQTYICRDLLGLIKNDIQEAPAPRTNEYYKVRPCAKYVGDAAEILENALKNSN